MKAQVLTDIGQMEMRTMPVPVLRGPKDVLLKVEYVGVCGSDVHYYQTGRIGSQVVSYPFIVGHECAAMVVEIGSAVSRVKVGDIVAVDPAVSCHKCDQCLAGRPHTCRNLVFLGCPGQLPGCLCEYIIMPEECCFTVTGKLSLEQAVLTEPLAIGVYAVQLARVAKECSVGILGSGPIGLSCLLASRVQGAKAVYMTDRIDHRVNIAASAGADWAGNPDRQDNVERILSFQPAGLDIVFECAGQQDTLDQALELLAPGGKLMLVGIPREPRISFSPDLMRRKEITVINVRRQNNCTQQAVDLMAEGAVKADFMITHRFGFEQAGQAFDMVSGYRDGVIKAMIKVD